MYDYKLSEVIEKRNLSRERVFELSRKGLISFEIKKNLKFYSLSEIDSALNENSKKAEQYYKINKSKKTDIKAIELFSGCGGLALGLKNAGVNAEMLVEIDKDSCDTLSLNFLNSNIICDDIAKIDFTSYKGKIDIVAGGFP